ncbi:AAA family ATPase [Rosistilla oblonga]|uniref:AAA family ATPase n=1 Tax=Rosistilla oblonga TaxID=2527990 RepID=UPI003A96EDEC
MSTTSQASRTGCELLKALRTSVARFYPCDFHVHSPGSYDVCQAGRLEQLPDDLRSVVQSAATKAGFSLPLTHDPTDAAAFDEAMARPDVVNAFLTAIMKRRDNIVCDAVLSDTDNWCIVGITDHNSSHFACALAEAAWKTRRTNRVIVCPGIELDVSFDVPGLPAKCQVHVLCLFAPSTGPSDIRIAINDSRPNGTPTWTMGQPIAVSDLASFITSLRGHETYPAFCIAAHVGSKKGVQNEPSKMILAHLDAEIARLEGELSRASQDGSAMDARDIHVRLASIMENKQDRDSIHLDVLRIIGMCGFDALQVRDQSQETHYRRLHRFREQQGRGVPVVCSDAHTPTATFQSGSGIPFAKVSPAVLSTGSAQEVFSEIRDRVLRFGETRTTYASPGAVTHWIEGIEIVRDAQEASGFWNVGSSETETSDAFTLELSRNLNCFVGGRGSGKSAGIEAIAFLADAERFTREGRKRDAEDWYLRAKATLAGCRVRLVWKSTAEDGIALLPKKALIVSRYFDSQGTHQPVDKRDAHDNAIVNSSIGLPRVRILRVHEIEETARAENLRLLFDDLCGPRIVDLTTQIEAIRTQLVRQRAEIMDVVTELAKLTADSSPLRQYGVRKIQFDTVNKPELQSRFQAVDKAAESARLATSTVTAWETLNLGPSLTELANDAKQFFQTSFEGIPQTEDGFAEHHRALANLLSSEIADDVQATENGGPATPSAKEQVLNALQDAQNSANSFTAVLTGVKSDTDQIHVQKTDALAKEGIPTGSSERGAKKRAFDEAKIDLGKYETLIAQLKDLLIARQTLHQQLVDISRQRTQLRETTAADISSQLSRDLDSSVLQIQLQAKPMQDQIELERWLSRYVGPAISTYRQHRLKALLASGVMPAALRELLLDDGDPDVAILKNVHQRAEDGKIDHDTALRIFARCRGRRRVSLDEAESWTEEFRQSLPDTVRDGVVTFPTIAESEESCIERVLELDEVVLNDSAEVRLNDRPTDQESEPRPLDELSPGQRCSAILPILLLSGDYPLIIDQPEENLDNRLIRQVIVNILASMKLSRQVIIATHNPNLPVLGDAEQCVVLQARGRNLSEVVATGNLDSPNVAKYITDIMEGGREAFQYRQSIYQNHWAGAVETE